MTMPSPAKVAELSWWIHRLTGTDFLPENRPANQEWKPAGAWRLEFEFYVDNDPFHGSAPGPEADFDSVGAQVGDISPSG
ncbi:MAG: hypothetical protein LAP13_07725 [Acidobacteriia bacterium]|nr:hypothetical protein [Terriglobia bacterium]